MKRLRTVVASLTVAFTVISLILSGAGCKKEEKPVQQLITIDNLQTAYGAELKRVNWYRRYAARAEKEGLKNAAQLFRAVARSEELHAATHAKLLKSRGFEPQVPQIDSIPLGYTLQHLKSALATESREFESMYPNIAKTAEVENFPEAADDFKHCRDVDARHSELFKDASDRNGNIPRVTYYICPECGYILTSEKTEECPVCHVKKDRFEKAI